MKHLLKVDFYRILKSKLLIIALVLAVGLPLLFVLLYYGLDVITSGASGEGLGDLINVKTLLNSCYSITNNIGIVVPIFSAVLVNKDLSSGMIRNKIIAGHKRGQIFFSHLITSIIFNVVIISVYTLMTALFGSIFFKYGKSIDSVEVRNIIYFVVTGTMIFTFIATVTTLFGLNFKSLPPIIIFTIVFGFVLSIVTTIINFLDYDKYKYILNMIPTYSMTHYTSLFGLLNGNFETDSFVIGIISLLVFGTLNVVIGCLIFKRKELK